LSSKKLRGMQVILSERYKLLCFQLKRAQPIPEIIGQRIESIEALRFMWIGREG
jgi:hypothetical protein